MTALLDTLPYARFLGLISDQNGDVLTVTMPFADQLIGNPFPRKLHGGSTAAMLEFTAVAQVALLGSLALLAGLVLTGASRSRAGRGD